MGAVDEIVALYDPAVPEGRVVGSAPRSRVRAENLPHAATSVLVRRSDGAVYVHRRTDTKDVFPGLHDCWAGGVVLAGEDPDRAARRELAEELGISGVSPRRLFTFWYADGATTYLAFVYDVVWDGPVVHQPEEVAEGGWMPLEELLARLGDPGWPFVPDGRRGLSEYVARGYAGSAAERP
jgi:8-oxo-dGTP pyrophosphatase MutT (NUDIX family)